MFLFLPFEKEKSVEKRGRRVSKAANLVLSTSALPFFRPPGLLSLRSLCCARAFMCSFIPRNERRPETYFPTKRKVASLFFVKKRDQFAISPENRLHVLLGNNQIYGQNGTCSFRVLFTARAGSARRGTEGEPSCLATRGKTFSKQPLRRSSRSQEQKVELAFVFPRSLLLLCPPPPPRPPFPSPPLPSRRK